MTVKRVDSDGYITIYVNVNEEELRVVVPNRFSCDRFIIWGDFGEEVGEGLAFGGVVAEVFLDEAFVREEEAVEGGDARLEPLDGREHLGHPNAAVLIGIEVAG